MLGLHYAVAQTPGLHAFEVLYQVSYMPSPSLLLISSLIKIEELTAIVVGLKENELQREWQY